MTSQDRHSEAPTVVTVGAHDDRASLRYRLDAVREDGRVALVLPWDVDFLSRDLDFDLLRREVRRRQLRVAIVSPDPERRQLARGCGFAAFPTIEEARATDRWNGHGRREIQPPPRHWWEPEVDLEPKRGRPRPTWLTWLRRGVRFAAFFLAIAVIAGSAYAIIPTAEVTLVPSGRTVSVTVPVLIAPSKLSSPSTSRPTWWGRGEP